MRPLPTEEESKHDRPSELVVSLGRTRAEVDSTMAAPVPHDSQRGKPDADHFGQQLMKRLPLRLEPPRRERREKHHALSICREGIERAVKRECQHEVRPE